MKTDSIEVGRVLQDNRRFTVPIYQRQYAWKDDRLQPFWEDIVSKADELLEQPPKFQHYMGALILAPGADGYSVGRIASVQVVDGQQRLTTFQLFLAALRMVATEKGFTKIRDALDMYLFNDERSAKADAGLADRLKLLPTPADRDIFRDLLTEPLAEVKKKHNAAFYKNGSVIAKYAPRALLAFLNLYHKIHQYVSWGSVEQDEEPDVSQLLVQLLQGDDGHAGERLQALADALLIHFKLVIISLEDGDDAQVIFETLNSRGEPLLAMDLVRNNIFHRAEAQGETAEKLFETQWKPYDALFWKEDAPRAKPKRPRIDHFLSYALTAQTGQETSLRELYAEYRAFARPRGKPRFESVGDELGAFLKFNPIYEALEKGGGDPDVAWLGRKLATWELSSVYPLVFVTANAEVPPEEKRTIYRLIYSYVVRRAVCDLTGKNMNKNFIRLVSIFNDKGVSVEVLKGAFSSQTGPAVRFPDDKEFVEAIRIKPIYSNIQRSERIVDILWELESAMRSKFQINERRPDFLSVEHILPQSWREHWPLPDGRSVAAASYPYDDAMEAGVTHRDGHLHRLGNLTLVTAPLNSSMQNQGYDKKCERLAQSLLAMNQAFAGWNKWGEEMIAERGNMLAELAVNIWPMPV